MSKPRIRALHWPLQGPFRYVCGLMEPQFDAGWVYCGMAAPRGYGHTPKEAYEAWKKRTVAAADSAASTVKE